jgi:hypothetical protein
MLSSLVEVDQCLRGTGTHCIHAQGTLLAAGLAHSMRIKMEECRQLLPDSSQQTVLFIVTAVRTSNPT